MGDKIINTLMSAGWKNDFVTHDFVYTKPLFYPVPSLRGFLTRLFGSGRRAR
jgi:hypothetical protein